MMEQPASSTRAARDRLGGQTPDRGQNVRRDPTEHGRPLVLGIETSCDETGVGLVRGTTLLADAVASSVDEHARFGGVVPEVASRAHLEAMVPTIERACETAGISLYDVDAVAVTSGPGLAGACSSAWRRRRRSPSASASRSTASTTWPPTSPSTSSSTARCQNRAWPCWSRRALLAARGRRRDRGVEPLGATIDDAAGRGIRQGGPAARACRSRAARHRPRSARGPRHHRLPAGPDLASRPRAAPLRLLVLRAQDGRGPMGRGPSGRGEPVPVADVAASFQEAVCDVLVRKALDAAPTAASRTC